MHKQMCNVSDMEILRKNQKEIWRDFKKYSNGNEECFDRLATAHSTLKDISTETCKTEKQREKRLKNVTEYPKTIPKDIIYA